MDIKQYEHAKFELADILRSVSLTARAAKPENIYPFEELFARLAEDRFNIVIAGQFSRGKTSLINAMLDTERLPTGIVPLTSVITTVEYGPAERAVIEYQERRLPSEIPLESLPEYITQRHNPGNRQRIRLARVELPSDVLRRGFYLVDTPGVGSVILENTRTTEDFLPEADALILVTSYDSPLSDEEMRLLADMDSNRCRTFLIVNKQDLASEGERQEVEDHIRAQTYGAVGEQRIEIFSLSAREAMEANRSSDRDGLVRSGLSGFMERLTRFLIEEKQSAFLRGMCRRVQERLEELGNTNGELTRLAILREQIAFGTGDSAMEPAWRGAARVVPRFAACQVCIRVERHVLEFLRKYQYEITISRNARRELAEAGGLCPFHTWQYAGIASPHGTCIGFPDAVDRLAQRLRDDAWRKGKFPGAEDTSALLPTDETCVLCRTRATAESGAVEKVARLVGAAAAEEGARSFPDICLPHLPRIAAAISDCHVTQRLIAAEAESLELVAEDMRRYALKRDGTRRALTTLDEANAHLRGLIALAGHSDLNFAQRAG